ncbi:S-layer family protein [Paenibacillus pabuli]|uniref:S-layer family protein n=1 Tax=Paenibacillus pabuli TaxID=1472 RepID=A0ABX9BF24_9BACL|nr:S-layer homology domain-containing protein [Paenibacillus pabuli]RAI89631.1 S-layer family protein [Paenibacillus pabuli]
MNKISSKIAGIALAIVLTVGLTNSTALNAHAASTQFSDVSSAHWATSAITEGVSKGYVDGYTDGTFRPDINVTRAEFMKMVVSSMKLETKTASSKWYSMYVDAASNAGLYTPDDFINNEEGWKKVITRDEMARVAARAIGQVTNENDKWMYLATKAGLIKGVGIGQIAPKGLTTRAQAVVVIDRIISKNSGSDLDIDKYAVGSAEIAWHGTNIFTVMPEMWDTTESDLSQARKASVEEMWKEDRMTITSKDGLYQGKLDALIAIDLADPKDPNLGLIKPINTLKWSNNRPTIRNLMVKDQKNSYVLYFKGGTVFNKDKKRYLSRERLSFRVDGFDSPDRQAFYADKGVLNASAFIYRDIDLDMPAVIIPKTGTVQNFSDLVIRLETPTSGWWYSESVILRLRGTHQKSSSL